MRKPKPSSNKPPTQSPRGVASTSTPQPATTTSAIAADAILGYRVRVLLHDFLNFTKDPNAARRINSTTNAQYIGAPYFDESETAMVKAAVVDVNLSKHRPIAAAIEYAAFETDTEDGSVRPDITELEGQTFETAVHTFLSSFFDKRRASGDARPCGPHHLAPLYASLFGIGVEEMQDEKFLSRLRRAGLTRS